MRTSSAIHEDLSRAAPVAGSSDRSFGVVFAVFFALVGIAPWLRGGRLRIEALAVGAAFLAVALIAPRLLQPLNRLWFRFGLLIHRIITPLIMALLFFIAVTPVALILRWRGQDPLRRAVDREAASYWIERRPPGPSPLSMPNQF